MEDEDKLEEVLCPTRLLTWLHPRHLLIKASMSLESTEGSEVIFLASARKNAKTQAKSTYLSNSSGLALFLHHADTFSRLVASWKLFTCRSMSMAWATGPTVRISDKASGMPLGLAPQQPPCGAQLFRGKGRIFPLRERKVVHHLVTGFLMPGN